MHESEIAMILAELERYLDEGALREPTLRAEVRGFLKGLDSAGPMRHPDFAVAVHSHPRKKELAQLLGWRDAVAPAAASGDVERATAVLDRIDRLLEAGAMSKPESRATLRRLLASLGPGDPLNSPSYLRALEKRPRRVELMRILEWRNSGEPPLRAQPVDKSKRACPYCGKVYRSESSIAQCNKCGRVSEITPPE